MVGLHSILRHSCILTITCLRSIALQPGEPVEVAPPADLKISNAALGVELTDENSRSSIRLIYFGPRASDASEDDEEDDEEEGSESGEPVATVLCSLTPGRVR